MQIDLLTWHLIEYITSKLLFNYNTNLLALPTNLIV